MGYYYNVQTGQAKTQLIAHNKEVYDIAFAPDANLFTSVGADGSVRLFDLRAMDHSTILFESPGIPIKFSMARLNWNVIIKLVFCRSCATPPIGVEQIRSQLYCYFYDGQQQGDHSRC